MLGVGSADFFLELPETKCQVRVQKPGSFLGVASEDAMYCKMSLSFANCVYTQNQQSAHVYMSLRRCLRSGIEITRSDEVVVLRSGARAFVALARMMPVQDDTSYDYLESDLHTAPVPTAPSPPTSRTMFPVCIGDGRVAMVLNTTAPGAGSRVTSFWYAPRQFSFIYVVFSVRLA